MRGMQLLVLSTLDSYHDQGHIGYKVRVASTFTAYTAPLLSLKTTQLPRFDLSILAAAFCAKTSEHDMQCAYCFCLFYLRCTFTVAAATFSVHSAH